jgi:SAM-dependent methyltransferase
MTRARLDKQPHDVAAMFDEVAERYDLTNDVMTAGQMRLWRRAVREAVDAHAGERVLDLAAGTGTSSGPFAASGARVVPCDFSLGMLQVGKRREPGLPFVAGDALRLPFADATFDAVTISFGLRNVSDTDAALRELLRVTRPGRPAGRVRDLGAGAAAGPPRVRRRTHPGTALARPPDRLQPRRVRLPGGVDRRLAGPADARGAREAGRLGARRLAQPDRRRGGPAPRQQTNHLGPA